MPPQITLRLDTVRSGSYKSTLLNVQKYVADYRSVLSQLASYVTAYSGNSNWDL